MGVRKSHLRGVVAAVARGGRRASRDSELLTSNSAKTLLDVAVASCNGRQKYHPDGALFSAAISSQCLRGDKFRSDFFCAVVNGIRIRDADELLTPDLKKQTAP